MPLISARYKAAMNIPNSLFRSALIFSAVFLIAASGNLHAEQNGTESGQAYTLEECLELGLQENRGIHASKYAIKRAEAAVRSAMGAFGPSADLSLNHSIVRNESSGTETDSDFLNQDKDTMVFSIRQPLFTGLDIVNRYGRARLEKVRQETELRQAEIDLELNIRQSFVELLWAAESVRAYEASVRRLKGHVEAARAFYDVGMKPWVSVLQAEVDLADARQGLSKARNMRRVQKVRLAGLLNVDPETAIAFEGKLAEMPLVRLSELKECRATALQGRPDLTMARNAVEIAEKDVRLHLARYAPQVTLDYSYYDQGIDYDEYPDARVDRQYWTLGVNMSWNLFDSGQTFHDVQQAKHEVSRMQAALEEMEVGVVSDVTRFYLDLLDARDRIGVARTALSEAREGYEMAETRFKTGEGTTTEVLDAEERITNAETNLNRALAEFHSSRFGLLHAMGGC